jgi:hypothetical protein
MKENAVKPRNPLVYIVPVAMTIFALGTACALLVNSASRVELMTALVLVALATSIASVLAMMIYPNL